MDPFAVVMNSMTSKLQLQIIISLLKNHEVLLNDLRLC